MQTGLSYEEIDEERKRQRSARKGRRAPPSSSSPSSFHKHYKESNNKHEGLNQYPPPSSTPPPLTPPPSNEDPLDQSRHNGRYYLGTDKKGNKILCFCTKCRRKQEDNGNKLFKKVDIEEKRKLKRRIMKMSMLRKKENEQKEMKVINQKEIGTIKATFLPEQHARFNTDPNVYG